MGQPVDINHIPVHQAMDLFGVKDKLGCFRKVLIIADHMIEIWNSKQNGGDD